MPDPSSLTRHLYDQVATGDRATLEGLVAEDFWLCGGTPRLGRADWIDALITAGCNHVDIIPVSASIELDQVAIVTATVRHRTSVQIGERESWTVVDIWHRRGVDWKLLSRTAVPSPP
jgi:Domain of unknown function (DUF4440)